MNAFHRASLSSALLLSVFLPSLSAHSSFTWTSATTAQIWFTIDGASAPHEVNLSIDTGAVAPVNFVLYNPNSTTPTVTINSYPGSNNSPGLTAVLSRPSGNSFLLKIDALPNSIPRGTISATQTWYLTVNLPSAGNIVTAISSLDAGLGSITGAKLDVPPQVYFSSPSTPPSVTAGQTVTFQEAYNGGTPDAAISAYAWTFAGASIASASSAGPQTVTYTGSTNTSPGYAATLLVTDALGQQGTATVNVGLTNNPPSGVSISMSPDSTTPFTGARRHFTAAAVDELPADLSYAWTVTGGTPSSTTSPSIDVDFGAAGTGSVALTVTDNVSQSTPASPLSLNILPKELLVIPAFSLLPANYAPPVIDGKVSEDLGTAVPDVSWSGATRIDYGDGTTRDLAIQALNCPDAAGKRCLYLSFELRNDPSFDTGDYVLLAFRGPGAGTTPDTSSAFLEGDVAIIIYALPSGASPGSNLTPNLIDFRRYQSGAWVSAGTGAASLTGFDAKSRVLPATTPQAWDLEVKVPMDDESATDSVLWPDLKNNFLFYCNVGRLNSTSGQLVQLSWPREAPELSGTLSPNLLAASDWSGASTDPSVQGRGVYINSAADIGVLDSTGTLLGNEISTVHDNGFRATVLNSSLATTPGATTPTGVAAPKVSATFRIAAWGTSYDSPQWSIIPANAASANPTAAHDIAAPTDPAGNGSFTSPGSYTFGFEAPALPVLNGMRHQCLFVELKSLGAARIVNNRVYRNMEYVDASKFEDQARVDPGYLRPLPAGRDFERIFLQVAARSFERDLRPRQPNLSHGTASPPITTLVWTAHSLRDTGRYLVVRGRSYLIVQRSGSFGYVLRHEGDAAHWKFDIRGAKKIGQNLYQYDIPLARMKAGTPELVFPAIEPVDRRWRISLQAGTVLPLSPIASNYGPGFAAALDAGLLVAPDLRLGLLLGYAGLVGKSGTANRDFASASLQVAYVYALNGPWSLEARAGFGWYQVLGAYGDWGIHGGLAAEHALGRPLALRVETDFHRVLDMARSQFLTGAFGLVWKF